MSLDYDLTEITDKKVKFPPDAAGMMNDDLHVLIWTTIQVGINHITENNYREFAARMNYAVKLNGPFYNRIDDDGQPVPIVFDAPRVRDAIGLRTNVSPETRNQFVKRQQEIFFFNEDRRQQRLDEEATTNV